MRFGSVCSGIEAASVAWEPLGWKAAWFSEIEKFPSSVLAHHYPDTPNLGDMTALPDRILSGEIEAPEIFCGGTPCQAFSVAGLRQSLNDDRGNLSLTFVGIANAIDHVRSVRGDSSSIIFWENVPGVLNTKDNAFGCFIGALAGEVDPVTCPNGKWSTAGVVVGQKRAVAWRVLDAQYFGVAQRRRRVFVVASARADFDPAAILFEFEGVRRDIAPSREARQSVAPTVGTGAPFSRTGNERVEAEAMVVQVMGCEFGPSGGRFTDLNPTLDTRAKDGPIRNQLAGAVITMAHGQGGAEIAIDRTPTLTCNHEAPIAFHPTQDPISSTNVCHSLGANSNATAAVLEPIPIDTMNHVGRGDNHSFGDFEPGAPSYTLTKGHSHAVAQPIVAMRESGLGYWMEDTVAGTLDANMGMSGHANRPAVMTVPQAMAVRRLTPVECERLQGFPDGYTNIPWRKKPADECPDGPRYKALGNSWAVPVVRWIGKRIQEHINAP